MATNESNPALVDDVVKHPTAVAQFNLVGTSIEKTEEIDVDVYHGSKDELLSAGIVLPDQWPPEGKKYISWSQGQRVTRNCKKDETYRNINLYWELPRVSVGVPPSIRRARKLAMNARWQKERDDERQKDLTESANRAKRELKDVPTSEADFLQKSVSDLRSMAIGVFLKRLDELADWNGGYRFSTETKEAAFLAVDAIVEAMMQGEVIFDADRHVQIIAKHQAVIRAADPLFERQLKTLTTPNAAILEGEAS